MKTPVYSEGAFGLLRNNRRAPVYIQGRCSLFKVYVIYIVTVIFSNFHFTSYSVATF